VLGAPANAKETLGSPSPLVKKRYYQKKGVSKASV
jgi:hypothetical protein